MPTKKKLTRLERVRAEMAAHGLTQLVVSDPMTIFYLTGLRIDPGERMYCLLLSSDGSARLFVNRLFGTPDVGLPVINFDDTDDAPALLAPYLDVKKALGVDKDWPARFLLRLQELPVAREYRVGSICCDMVARRQGRGRAAGDDPVQPGQRFLHGGVCRRHSSRCHRAPAGGEDSGHLQGPRLQRPQL